MRWSFRRPDCRCAGSAEFFGIAEMRNAFILSILLRADLRLRLGGCWELVGAIYVSRNRNALSAIIQMLVIGAAGLSGADPRRLLCCCFTKPSTWPSCRGLFIAACRRLPSLRVPGGR